MAFLQHRPVLFAGQQPALDAPGIEQEGEPCAVRVPQLLVHLEERECDFFFLRVEQVDVAVGAALAHRRGKMQIKLEQILRERVGGRADLVHDGFPLGRRRLEPKGRHDGTGLGGLKDGMIIDPGLQREKRLECQEVVHDPKRTLNRRQFPPVHARCGLGMDMKGALPVGWFRCVRLGQAVGRHPGQVDFEHRLA